MRELTYDELLALSLDTPLLYRGPRNFQRAVLGRSMTPSDDSAKPVLTLWVLNEHSNFDLFKVSPDLERTDVFTVSL